MKRLTFGTLFHLKQEKLSLKNGPLRVKLVFWQAFFMRDASGNRKRDEIALRRFLRQEFADVSNQRAPFLRSGICTLEAMNTDKYQTSAGSVLTEGPKALLGPQEEIRVQLNSAALKGEQAHPEGLLKQTLGPAPRVNLQLQWFTDGLRRSRSCILRTVRRIGWLVFDHVECAQNPEQVPASRAPHLLLASD